MAHPDVDPPRQADAGEPTDRLDPMMRVDQTGARGVPGTLASHGEEIGTVERGQGGRVGDAIHVWQATRLAPHDAVPALEKNAARDSRSPGTYDTAARRPDVAA